MTSTEISQLRDTQKATDTIDVRATSSKDSLLFAENNFWLSEVALQLALLNEASAAAKK